MPVKLEERSPFTSADWLCTIGSVPGYFSKFSGVKKKFSRAQYSDGLSNIKRVAMSGAIEYENVTISKAFDPIKDDGLMIWLSQHECGEPFDTSVIPVKRCNGIEKRGSKGWYLSGCRLVEYHLANDTDTMDGTKTSDLVIVYSFDSSSWSGSSAGASS